MPIISSELKLFKSNSGVGLGGAISATEVVSGNLNNLFDDVSSSEALSGKTEYRCCYVKNTNAAIALLNSKVFIASNTSSPFTNIQIGLGTAGIGNTEQTVPTETTAPAGVTFSDTCVAYTSGLVIGTLPANGGYMAVWVKRVVSASAVAVDSDVATLTLQGETTT